MSAAIRKAANHPVPLKRLIDFDRKTIQPGKSATYTFAYVGSGGRETGELARETVAYPMP